MDEDTAQSPVEDQQKPKVIYATINQELPPITTEVPEDGEHEDQ